MKNLLLTCEHVSNKIPTRFKKYFKPEIEVPKTHKGWDIGSYEVFLAFSKAFPLAYHQHARWSRLLVDLNRSEFSPSMFSSYITQLPEENLNEIIRRYYRPYRQKIISNLEKRLTSDQPMVHVAIHSFTPILNGKVRKADIGLLYDPGRACEAALAQRWRKAIIELAPKYVVRMNYPYWGKTDGFCTALRKKYNNQQYIGLELEINQKMFSTETKTKALKKALIQSFSQAIQD